MRISPTRATVRWECRARQALRFAQDDKAMIEPGRVRGLWCATLTPLDRDGRVDNARLAAHLRLLLGQGVDGVAPFGTTGEGPSFSVAERRAGLEGLLSSSIGASRIVAATGSAAFTDAVELTRHALGNGVYRCLVMPPFFFKDVSDEAVYAFFADLIEAVGDSRLRLYLYHIPQLSGVPVKPAVVARLAEAFPGIVSGVKDSAGDWNNTATLLERTPQLDILVGHEPHLPQLMRRGGAGTICGVANVYPGIVRALLARDVTAADQARIERFIDVLFRFAFLPAFKAIKAAQVDDAGWCAVRAPWTALTQGARDDLVEALESAGFAVRNLSAGQQ
jgi:4-hydroxy-tetrahydrodipicolinate synthase